MRCPFKCTNKDNENVYHSLLSISATKIIGTMNLPLECICCAILCTIWITKSLLCKISPSTNFGIFFLQDSTFLGLLRNAVENSLLVSVSNWQMGYSKNKDVFCLILVNFLARIRRHHASLPMLCPSHTQTLAPSFLVEYLFSSV